MNLPNANPARAALAWGATAVFTSLIVQNVGAAYAKQLFGEIEPLGMTALRIGLAAPMLLLISGAWRRWPRPADWRVILGYGIALGAMNALIYQAFARIPIGIAVSIEVLGPLAVVVAAARRRIEFACAFLAAIGLWLLLNSRGNDAGTLDPIGVASAIAAAVCWALYILFGKRASSMPGLDAVAWGMLIAALLTVPLGLHSSGMHLLAPQILLSGLAVAALSSAIPYSLELFALRRLSAALFGVMIATAPAIAAMAGFVMLDEALTAGQVAAIALIGLAVAGSTWASRSSRAR